MIAAAGRTTIKNKPLERAKMPRKTLTLQQVGEIRLDAYAYHHYPVYKIPLYAGCQSPNRVLIFTKRFDGVCYQVAAPSQQFLAGFLAGLGYFPRDSGERFNPGVAVTFPQFLALGGELSPKLDSEPTGFSLFHSVSDQGD